MKLSVIIPTCNRLSEINNCLQSLLHQKILPYEIIIVDNSSLFNTMQVKSLVDKLKSLTKVKLIYYHEKNKGVSFCRNLGIKKSQGEILAFLDDDCIVSKNWTDTILHTIKKYKNSIIVGKNIYGSSKSILSFVQYYRSKRVFTDTIYKKNNINYSQYIDTKNFALTRSLIKKYHLTFDTFSGFCPFSAGEDLDFSMQALINKIPLIYCCQMVAYHKGASTIRNFITREFTKGRAFYHFRRKWPNYKLDKSRFNVFTELLFDRSYREKIFLSKFFILILFILPSIAHKVGIQYEKMISVLKQSQNL